jgi:predicted metal-dependent phosphoesterase TrpH
MKRELANYIVTPRIVLADVETEITIRPLGPHAVFKKEKYQAMFVPVRMSRAPDWDYDVIPACVSDDGCLRVKYRFIGEQEYILDLFTEDADFVEHKGSGYHRDKMVLTLHLYSLFEDLYARRPYKGDFHVHSSASDGKECPEITAANYRKNGFDFYSLTDHGRYWPSVQCKAYYDAKSVDFKVFHGEEVHSPGNHVHIINFGARYSVNELFQKDPDTYDREVREILDTITVPEGIKSGYEYAACLWVFRKIKEAGGLAIYPHPHWQTEAYHDPDALSDALFMGGEFNVFELLCGHILHSNNVQTAYWNEKRAQGISVPIVGSSDSHGSELGDDWFNWIYSIVFSKGLELEDIKEAVMSGYSSAVDQYPGNYARVHGSYRMTLYSRFLLEEYFPLHEELCFEEGRQMKAMFLGDAKAEELLKLMRGRTDALLKQYWGLR